MAVRAAVEAARAEFSPVASLAALEKAGYVTESEAKRIRKHIDHCPRLQLGGHRQAAKTASRSAGALC